MATTKTAARHRWTHYLVIWLALVFLTVLSLLLSLAHLGELDTVIAMLIAAAKSTIVLVFFMHLVEEGFTVRIVPVLALGYVALLLALMAGDVLGRKTFPRTPSPLVEPRVDPPRPEPAGGEPAPP
jgi:cytochrome c oxidase subunit 4